MRWVRQNPVTEDSCGQCCLAMLLAIGKREAIKRVGHDLGTTTRELTTVLRAGGLTVGPRLKRVRSYRDVAAERALLLGYWKRYPHWMVWNDGRVYDPVEGVIHARRDGLPRVIKITHFLDVSRGPLRPASRRDA